MAVGTAEAVTLVDGHLGVVLVVVAQIQLPHASGNDVHLAQCQLDAAHGIVAWRREATITQHASCLRCGLKNRAPS